MEGVLGASIGAFVFVTLGLFGFIAAMTGQALARTWRPLWQIAPYGILLALAARFLKYALFGGVLVAPAGLAISIAILALVMAVTFRLTRARQMVTQYPWVYERAGLFGWRERA